MILDLDTLLWRQGPVPCPTGGWAVSIPYGGTFLMADWKNVYMYNLETGWWDVIAQYIETYRQGFAATLVPDDYIACS